MKYGISNYKIAAGLVLALLQTGMSQASNFTDTTVTGIPFASVQGDEGTAPHGMQNTIDGFVDSDSRWSYLGNGTLEYSLPLDSNNEPQTIIQGLYVWPHRSDQRRTQVTIKAEFKGNIGGPITLVQNKLLPLTGSRFEPVYIPVSNPYSHPIVKIHVTGEGNDGAGGSNQYWSSIAEVRYTTSNTPANGVTTLDAYTAYDLGCNRFERVQGGFIAGAQYTHSKRNVIDGNIDNLNYWGIDQPVFFETWLAQAQLISKVKIWMHKSDVRSSVVDITDDAFFQTRPDLSMLGVQLPITPTYEPTEIMLDPPVFTMHLGFNFSGNTQNYWNSISEICWE